MKLWAAAQCRAFADWLDPPIPPEPPPPKVQTLLERVAGVAVAQASRVYPDTSGEFKRHQVYAQLIKAFPDESHRVIARAIEEALS